MNLIYKLSNSISKLISLVDRLINGADQVAAVVEAECGKIRLEHAIDFNASTKALAASHNMSDKELAAVVASLA
jgi:hypothetical protein